MESGHTPSRNHPEWWDGDIAWIGIADAREHDGKIIHETLQHTNPEGIANSASRVLPAGTVCISRTASVGYVVVMGREMATSQDFVNWTPTPAVTSDWLRIVFSADREALRRFGKGSVHKTIYFPEWLSIHIAVPPLEEQHRIVAEVDRRVSMLEELEGAVLCQLRRATNLRKSILDKAFAGEI
jgi:type I restriction enzyme S subunit